MPNLHRIIARKMSREQFGNLIEKGLASQFQPEIRERMGELVDDTWEKNTLLLIINDGGVYKCTVCDMDVEPVFKAEQAWCPSCSHSLKAVGVPVPIGGYMLAFVNERIEYVKDWAKRDISPSIVLEMSDDTLFDIVKGRRFPNGAYRKVSPLEAFYAGDISTDRRADNWLVHVNRLEKVLKGIDDYLRAEVKSNG